MIDLHQNMITRREVWFDEEWKPQGADLVVFYHWSQPQGTGESLEVLSLEVDLTQEEEAIWKGFTSTARNLVNRGIKEGLTSQIWTDPSPEIIGEFIAFQEQFAAERQMAFQAPTWMYEYAKQGALLLTVGRDRNQKPLVWHSYYRDPRWVRLLHSVSLSGAADPEEKKAIGWANRYLHWIDIQECRKAKVEHYDFGGLYSGSTDEKLLGINAFKEQFGGQRTTRYHSMLPLTTKGKLFLTARAHLKKERGLVHFV